MDVPLMEQSRILLDRSQARALVEELLPSIREHSKKYTGRGCYDPSYGDIPPLDRHLLNGRNSSIVAIVMALCEGALKERDPFARKYMLEIAFSQLFKLQYPKFGVGSILQWALFKIYTLTEPRLDKEDFFEDGNVLRLLEVLWHNTRDTT